MESKGKGCLQRISFPPLGLRIVKTSIAVFLCFLVNMLRGNQEVVFYSQMAAIWCLQDTARDTRKNGAQQVVGTGVGALFGLVTILLFPSLAAETARQKAVHGLVISLMVGVILYATVVIRKLHAAYFSNVVYLSIVIYHLTDGDPFLFAWNRFLDTMIGIGIAWLVNSCRMPREKHRDILFVSRLDGVLINGGEGISGYNRVELNRMIQDGAQFTVVTGHSPTALAECRKNLTLKLPVIVMDGAALYDVEENRYVRVYVISGDSAAEAEGIFRAHGVHWFSNVVLDDTLVVYYQDTDDLVYHDMVEKRRRSPYRNFVKRELPPGEEVVYFQIVDRAERVEALCRDMEASGFSRRFRVVKTESEEYPGCLDLKLYNRNAVSGNMVDYLKDMLEVKRAVTFGGRGEDCTHAVEPGDGSHVVKLMRREFEPVKVFHRRR